MLVVRTETMETATPCEPSIEGLICPTSDASSARTGLPSRFSRMVHHPLSPFTRRAFYAVLVLGVVMAVGTLGMMNLEGWGLVDSFYFMALIATAEGPAATPATDAGKIFAAVMAFVSIGAVISAITFAFGPLFGSALKQGIVHVEKEEEKLREKLVHKNSQDQVSGEQQQ